MVSEDRLARLRWQCRRGMLELDLLLGDFLEHQFSDLSAEEQEDFVKLLSCHDQDLYHWLIKHQSPTDPQYINLIKRITDYAQRII